MDSLVFVVGKGHQARERFGGNESLVGQLWAECPSTCSKVLLIGQGCRLGDFPLP